MCPGRCRPVSGSPGSGAAGFVAPPQTTAEQLTTLTVRRAGSRITVRGDVDGVGHAAFAREAFVLVPHGSDAARVRIVNRGEPFEVTLA